MTIYALDKLSASPVTLSRHWADGSTLWVNAEDVILSLGKPSKIGTWRLDPVINADDPYVRALHREIEDDLAALGKEGTLKSRGGRRLNEADEREAAMNAGLAIRALERAADGSSETVTLILRKAEGYAYRQTPVGFITFRRSTTSLPGRSAVSMTFAVDHVYVTPRNRGRGYADAMISAVYSTFHYDVETIAAAASRGAIAIGACIAWTSPEPVFEGLLADLVDAFNSSYEATGSYDIGSCFVTLLEPVVTAP